MAIKNLAPRDNNSGGRIIKNMRICGSGIYEYHKSEAALMGLDPAQCPGDTFKVYRPADVLISNKDLYARVPIITGHHVRVNTANAKKLAVGMVGDTVESEVGEDGETYLYTTGTIIADDGIEAYEKLGQLSVGYDPLVKWESGVHGDEHYDAVLTGLNEVNHLLICRTARGGPQCMIMDEAPWGSKIFEGGRNMSIFKKIFGSKPMHGDAAVVSTLLQSISAGADPETQIAKVRGMIGDCKDEEFMGYLDELAGCKGEDMNVVTKAVDIVDSYYKKNIAGDEKEKATDACDTCACDSDKAKDDSDKAKDDSDKAKDDSDKAKDGSDVKVEVEEEKQNGDAVDYERIAKMIGDALDARLRKEEPKANLNAVQELNIAMGGDEKSELSSDALMKNIF